MQATFFNQLTDWIPLRRFNQAGWGQRDQARRNPLENTLEIFLDPAGRAGILSSEDCFPASEIPRPLSHPPFFSPPSSPATGTTYDLHLKTKRLTIQ